MLGVHAIAKRLDRRRSLPSAVAISIVTKLKADTECPKLAGTSAWSPVRPRSVVPRFVRKTLMRVPVSLSHH